MLGISFVQYVEQKQVRFVQHTEQNGGAVGALGVRARYALLKLLNSAKVAKLC